MRHILTEQLDAFQHPFSEIDPDTVEVSENGGFYSEGVYYDMEYDTSPLMSQRQVNTVLQLLYSISCKYLSKQCPCPDTPEKRLPGQARRTHILCGGASFGCLVLSRDRLSVPALFTLNNILMRYYFLFTSLYKRDIMQLLSHKDVSSCARCCIST